MNQDIRKYRRIAEILCMMYNVGQNIYLDNQVDVSTPPSTEDFDKNECVNIDGNLLQVGMWSLLFIVINIT